MKQVTFFVLLALSILSTKAQTLKGRVIDADSLPLKGVSVLLLDVNGRTVRFTKTSENGQFTLSSQGLPTLAGIVQGMLLFTHVGYAKDTINIHSFVKQPTVRLIRQAVTIKEVMVRPPRIIEHGDTLDYFVESFKQKQDRSIADVLKKIPGIEVKADGNITYQGTPINTFYIEGMDLMGSRYSIASENLQADKVKKIQVLQHHQPLKALRGMEFSQQAALNIVLKDDAQNVWQGMVDVDFGTPLQKRTQLLINGRLVGMLFAKHRQSISMYKTNNTGKDITREVDPSRIFDSSIPTDVNLVGNIQTITPSLKEERYRDNQSHLVASNWLFKPTSDSDLRLQLSGLFDKTFHIQQREIRYAEVGQRAIVSEAIDAKTYRRELMGELCYKLNSDNIYLNNTVEAYTDFNSGSGHSEVNGHNVCQLVKPHYSYLTDKLSIIKKISGYHTVSARAYLTYQYQPSTLLLTDSTLQYLQISHLGWGANTGYSYNIGPFTLNCSLNINGKLQRLHVSHEDTETHTHHNEIRTQLEPSIVYKNHLFLLSVGFPLVWLERNTENSHRSDVRLSPSLRAGLTPNGYWEITLNYAQSYVPYNLAQLTCTPIYTSYISIQQGTGRMGHVDGYTYGLHVNYKSPIKGIFATLLANIANTDGQPLYNSTLHNGIYIRKATEQTTAARTVTIYSRLSKSTRWARLLATLSFEYSASRYDILINSENKDIEQKTPYKIQSGLLTAGVSFQPLAWLSLEHNTHWQYAKQKSTDESAYNLGSLNSFIHETRAWFMFGSWVAELKSEIYYSDDKPVSYYFFSDVNITYRKREYEIGLIINNIFGNKTFERRFITNTQQIFTYSKIRQRELLLHVSLNI